MADDDAVVARIKDKRKRIQKVQAEHTRKNKERADKIKTTRAAYMAEKGSPVIADILDKANQFKNYNLKLAQDGVGARKTGFKLENGNEEVENYFLTNNQRASHLDKAAGIQQLIDYIERQLTPPTAPSKKA